MVRAKGGNVQGTVGKPYSNRTDLQGAEPITSAPGQEYGQRSQQRAAQRAVPLAPPPTPGPAAAPAGPAAAPQGGAPAPPSTLTPLSGPPPADHQGLVSFLHPTARPQEPITAGMASGPGPGPEILGGVGAAAANGAVEQGTLKSLLGSLANGPASSTALRDLAAVAGAG